MFDLNLDWDRPARTGTQPTSHTLRIRLTPIKRIGLGDGVPVAMAILLDTSGSMAGEKLARSKKACEVVVSLLRAQDRLWLAGFADDLAIVAEDIPGESQQLKPVISRIERLRAQGVTRTDVALQWIESCLANTADAARVGILITDGNPTDPFGKHNIDTAPLIKMAGRMGQAGITLCAVGLGSARAYNSGLLAQISDHGKGAFLYADTPESLEDHLAHQLNLSQTIGFTDAVLDISYVLPGCEISSACRFRPEYLPLEPLAVSGGCHIELGSVRADIDTDILINVTVPPPTSEGWDGSLDLLRIRLSGASAVEQVKTPSLLNTESYTEAQRRNDEVEKDRLNWDINRYSDVLLKTREQNEGSIVNMRKTGQLLTAMEQSARRAGNSHLAAEIASQVADLRKTGTLDNHRATGLLTSSRRLGVDSRDDEKEPSRTTGVLAVNSSVEGLD